MAWFLLPEHITVRRPSLEPFGPGLDCGRAPSNPHFLTPRNLSNLVLQIAVVGTLGTGVVLALLLGEIDLSLGAVAGVVAAILGVLVAQQGWSGLPAIMVALAAGAVMGLLQGTIVV